MTAETGRLRDHLARGDRRTTDAAGAVAGIVAQQPDLLPELIACLGDSDPAVVAHAAHAAMQLSERQPSLFDPHVDTLMAVLQSAGPWEIGEQMPKVLVRSRLSSQQCARLAEILLHNLDHRANIVAACSLQGLVDLAQDGRIDRTIARQAIDRALNSDRKALSARARRLQKQVASVS